MSFCSRIASLLTWSLLLPVGAQAATIACAGTVEAVSYHASNTSGVVMVKLSSMNTPVAFCDPEAPWSAPGSGYSVSPAACRALYATFLTAKTSGQSFAVVYFDGDHVPSACSSWPSWPSANVRYYVF